WPAWQQCAVQDVLGIRAKVVGGRDRLTRYFGNERSYSGNGAADGRLGYAERFADFCLGAVVPHVGQRGHHGFEKSETWRPINVSFSASHGIYQDAQVDDFFTVEPGGIIRHDGLFLRIWYGSYILSRNRPFFM